MGEVEALRADVDTLMASLDRTEAERDRYRDALIRIANAESGRWGWIAHDALHPERPPHEEYGSG